MGKIRKLFDPPCEEMMIVTSKLREKGREFQEIDLNGNGLTDEDEEMLYLDINFRNNNPTYQIIENDQGFTIEGCWAGIGGFIGIFIGVSLRQIPDFIIIFCNFARKLIK